MRLWSICLALAFALLPGPSGQSQASARNVVVITMDGFRWQEMFTGADRDYFKKGKSGEPGESEKRFWRPTADERRAIMWRIWSVGESAIAMPHDEATMASRVVVDMQGTP